MFFKITKLEKGPTWGMLQGISIPSLNKIGAFVLSQILGEPKKCLSLWGGEEFFFEFRKTVKYPPRECCKE